MRELADFRSTIIRHRRRLWKNSRSTRYHASPTRRRRCRPTKAKSPPSSKEKRFQLHDERGLKIGLGVLVLQCKKLEKIWILDFVIWRHDIRRKVGRTAAKHIGLIL